MDSYILVNIYDSPSCPIESRGPEKEYERTNSNEIATNLLAVPRDSPFIRHAVQCDRCDLFYDGLCAAQWIHCKRRLVCYILLLYDIKVVDRTWKSCSFVYPLSAECLFVAVYLSADVRVSVQVDGVYCIYSRWRCGMNVCVPCLSPRLSSSSSSLLSRSHRLRLTAQRRPAGRSVGRAFRPRLPEQ